MKQAGLDAFFSYTKDLFPTDLRYSRKPKSHQFLRCKQNEATPHLMQVKIKLYCTWPGYRMCVLKSYVSHWPMLIHTRRKRKSDWTVGYNALTYSFNSYPLHQGGGWVGWGITMSWGSTCCKEAEGRKTGPKQGCRVSGIYLGIYRGQGRESEIVRHAFKC